MQPSQIERIRFRLSSYRRNALLPDRLTPAAISLPLALGPDGSLDVLFTLRSHNVECHKGEISFPGGKKEPADATLVETALRETWEETGIDPADLEVLGELDDHVSVSGFLVTPVVVYLPKNGYSFRPEPGEVCEIFAVPLAHLADPANHRDFSAHGRHRDFHGFVWKERLIWGLTASILHHFLQIWLDFGKEAA